MSQSWPQIRYHLSLKSIIPDKVVTCDLAGGVTCFAGTCWDCTLLSFSAMNSILDYRGASKYNHKYKCCSNYLLSVLWAPSILPPWIFNFGKVPTPALSCSAAP